MRFYGKHERRLRRLEEAFASARAVCTCKSGITTERHGNEEWVIMPACSLHGHERQVIRRLRDLSLHDL
jgi:hypothetical protein